MVACVHKNTSSPSGHLLQSPLCLLGCQVVLLALALLVFQVLHGLHEDHEDPLSLEVQGVLVLQPDPGRNSSRETDVCSCSCKI